MHVKRLSGDGELIVDGTTSTLDITPLRLARFEENDPVKTPYSYGVMG